MSSIPAFNQTHATPNLNPLDAALAADSGAMALWGKVRGNYSTLVNAFGQLSTIADNLWREIVAIEGNTRLTVQAKAQDTANVRNAASEAAEALRQQCVDARAAILGVTAPVLDGTQFTPVRDAFGTTNYEASLLAIELTRDAWNRAKMLLDAAPDAGAKQARLLAAAKSASERNDKYAIAAIRQNGEVYLQAAGLSMPHESFVTQLNQAMIASSTPQMRAALQIEQTMEAGWRNLQAAFLTVMGYTKGSSAMRVQGLMAWPGFPTINL